MSAGIFDKYATLKGNYDSLMAASPRNPFGVVIERPLSATVGIIEGRETLLFGTNNYLGLSQSTAARDAAIHTAKTMGVGTTGSRIANGTFGLHQQLEKALTSVFRKKHAMVFSTGYQANLGTISALVNKDDILFLDADSHASIYDGARLSGAQVIRFRHNDPADLEKRVARTAKTTGARLIIAEGIYSMTGNIAPLKEFVEVKKRHNIPLMVDEAHSFGVLGEHGRGVAEMQGCEDDIDFIVGTFSKSLGTVGGYCVTDHDEIDLMRLCSRPYMFTASLPPEIIAATLAALEEIQNRPDLRQKLQDNAARLHQGFKSVGLNTSSFVSPVIAVTLEDIPQAITFWNALLDAGVYVNLSLPPATPDNRPLLRCSVMAAHSAAEIDRAVETFGTIAKELKLV
ncbi:8-amino-7-oxononanoate synthase [Parasaccharibacter sp. TMW2.1882]|uniref:serine palmitoyltransferase n=1 Tax=Acetobacteraceae TaxID=433 RepID=UPI0009DA0E3E|nr:8-amino-7-oxononanoate synthase [Parasaccharibacter sp. TMW2.1885]MCL1496141.1 8-amino-7-oxononanoate synthase [Parasaccharibacter sp. TMW2.1882]MPW00319.1 aminotransferase class I/II-fold pyridoxal phosphate-dependent enzyme [Bombella apis]MUG79454.1 aminotransferase class I/II-fold pyridoxal phosphate-dependent enzyme [Bombella sp. ESL0380]MUH02756.1 aminotransferase class I/II-fold pyridoxal phosphate-dependent enzyme [Bombella sp. ESL0387]